MSQNPYTPPQAGSASHTNAQTTTLLTWERLRIIYNAAVLLSIVVNTFPGYPTLLSEPKFWQSSLVVIVLANLGYATGHLVELCMRRFVQPANSSRWLLFGSYCLLAFAIAIAAVAAEMYPGL